jgi:hypothetical protein
VKSIIRHLRMLTRAKATLFFFLLLISYSLPATIDQPLIDNCKAGETYYSSYENSPSPIAFGLSALWEVIDCNKDDISAASTLVIALFTVVLGLFTVSLAGSTRRAAEAAERAAIVAERALIDADRPYIFVFSVSKFKLNSNTRATPRGDNRPSSNIQSPTMVECQQSLEEARADFLVPVVGTADNVSTVYEDNPLFALPILASGQRLSPIAHHRWRIRNVNDLDGMYHPKFKMSAEEDEPIEVTPLLGEKENLYFRVIIKYRGPTRGHETGVCWRYWKEFGFFDLAEGKTANYEK